MKFLVVSALVTMMSGTAVAQMIPEKCRKLNVTDYTLERDPNNENLYIRADIHNDISYNLMFATFSFDLLVDRNVKVGEVTQSIGRLLPEEIWKVRMYTSVKEITNIRVASISCSFSS